MRCWMLAILLPRDVRHVCACYDSRGSTFLAAPILPDPNASTPIEHDLASRRTIPPPRRTPDIVNGAVESAHGWYRFPAYRCLDHSKGAQVEHQKFRRFSRPCSPEHIYLVRCCGSLLFLSWGASSAEEYRAPVCADAGLLVVVL